jgi:YesN/AraC family two-component response regulator
MQLIPDTYRVYVYTIGPYREWGIEDMEFQAGQFRCEAELLNIQKERGTDYPDVWILNGYYPNMKIVVTQDEISNGITFYQKLKRRAQEQKLYITFAVSQEKVDFMHIRNTVQDCIHLLRSEMKTGVSQMLIMKADTDGNVENIVEKLWHHINSTYREGVDVNEFARKNGYHPVYLITQFSKLRGISPTKRVIQLRMQQACELLNKSDMSLKKIGEAVGYSDVSYFSRTFKEHEGVSPSMYRKQHKNS